MQDTTDVIVKRAQASLDATQEAEKALVSHIEALEAEHRKACRALLELKSKRGIKNGDP